MSADGERDVDDEYGDREPDEDGGGLGLDRSEAWDVLLAFLRRNGPTEVLVEDERLRWTPFLDGRTFEIVMSPEEWEDVAGIAWGDVDAACASVLSAAAMAAADHTFLLHRDYQLESWHEDHFPEEPIPDGPAGGGQWFADAEGTEDGSFAAHLDRELRQVTERLHIYSGLAVALDRWPEVSESMHTAESVDELTSRLRELLGVDALQAAAIIEMQLRRVPRREREKIAEERRSLEAQVADLRRELREGG